MKLKKTNDQQPDFSQFSMGDWYINSRGGFYQIEEVKTNENKIILKNKNWNSTTEESPAKLKNNYYRIYGNIEDFEKNYLNQEKINELLHQENESESTSTDLELRDKNVLLTTKQSLQLKINELNSTRALLERKRDQLSDVVYNMENKLSRVEKVINIIELYLGVKEEIITLKEGKSSEKNKITIRQMILYMDEEIGIRHHYDEGIDFSQINDFDEWIIQEKNLKKILPEEKSMVAMKIRRKDSPSLIEKANENFIRYLNEHYANNQLYFLIRNGENLYRIWSSIENDFDFLYPSKEKFEELHKMLDNEDRWDKDRLKDELLQYKKIALYLKGIIERTDIFKPLAYSGNENELWKNMNFIYDGTRTISDGMILFKDWQKNLNEKVKIGSRVYFKGFDWLKEDEVRYHFDFSIWSSDYPPPGVYIVKNIKKRYYGEVIVLHYNPGDEIWVKSDKYKYGEFRKRKKAIPFYLYVGDDCKNFLNYDLIDLKTVNYYINSRYNRRDYVDMLPILFDIRKIRLKELESEKKMIEDIIILFNNKINEKFVKRVIRWWKLKNKIKRPILETEKAYRMCLSIIRRILNKKVEKERLEKLKV